MLKEVKVSEKEIQEWVITNLSNALEIDRAEINIHDKYEALGVDSITMVQMTEDVGQWLGKKFDPTLLYHHPTIESLAKYLYKEIQK